MLKYLHCKAKRC